MKTFSNFVNETTLNGKIIEAATIMAAKDINPDMFLQTWYATNEPELAVYLNEAGIWDGVKKFGNAAWQGIKQGAQQFGQNVQQGAYDAARAVNGPMSQYQAAVKSLNGLVDYMGKDPQLAKSYGHVTTQVSKILNDLKGMQGQIPDSNQGQWKAEVDPMTSRMNMGSTGTPQQPVTNNDPQQPNPQQPNPQQPHPQQPASMNNDPMQQARLRRRQQQMGQAQNNQPAPMNNDPMQQARLRRRQQQMGQV
jgi:hypothetical protein